MEGSLEILTFDLLCVADTPPQKKIKLEGSAPGTPSSNTPRGSLSVGAGQVGEVSQQQQQQQQQANAPVSAALSTTPVNQVSHQI